MGRWMVVGALGLAACGLSYRRVPPVVRPLSDPAVEPADVARVVDLLLQGDPQVVMIGESHYESAQTRFATDLVLELADRGWVDAVVMEDPFSETLVHDRVADGGPPPPRLTLDQRTTLERFHGWSAEHPDRAFRVVTNDLEMGTAAQQRVVEMLERHGISPGDDDALRALAAGDGPDAHLAANVLATHAAFAAPDADFQRIRQEQVITNLTDPDRHGGWLSEEAHVVLWLGSDHTRLGAPCGTVRFEGCVLEQELGLRVRSVQMRSAAFTPGWMGPDVLTPCVDTQITEWMSWDVIVRTDRAFARRGYDVDLRNPDVRLDDLRRSHGAGGEPVMWRDPARASGHDLVVVFPTTALHQPTCAATP